MTAPVVLGVDIGTYETKGVLVDAGGIVVAQVRRPHRVGVPAAGRAEHDPKGVWWQGFVEVTARLLAGSVTAAEQVAAVAISGIGPCVLAIDEDGTPLRPAILYGVDARAGSQILRLESALGPDEIQRRSGTTLTSQSAGPKILWIEENEPEVFARTRRFVTCQTFVAGRLTGSWVMDHATAAYYHPFYDRRCQEWNLQGAPSALRQDQLPELGWSNAVGGTVTAAAARSTGLAEGTPVLVGAPDAPVEALSAGVSRPGDMMLMYGSSHFMIEVVDAAHSSPVLWPAPFLFPGSDLVAAGTATAGSFTRWYADLLSPGSGGTDELYEELARAAAGSPPGARGLLALPFLSGERTPLSDPGARGGLLGLSLQHGRGDVARAVVEGIAQSAAAALRAFDAEGLSPRRIRAVGGGVKNAVWVQAVSDVAGVRQEVAPGLGAAFGDAMLAGLAVGFLDDVEDCARWVGAVTAVEPRSELQGLYREQRTLYDRFYEVTRPIVVDLARLARDPVTGPGGDHPGSHHHDTTPDGDPR